MGRIYDAVSSMLGLCHFNEFEGQAAMKLEFIAEDYNSEDVYEYSINLYPDEDLSSIIIDWEQMVTGILDDLRTKVPAGIISAKFHNTLVDIIVEAANLIKEKNIVLCGGCFQNKYLIESAIKRLKKEGFRPYWNTKVPTNDGGISLGQLIAASYILNKE
ncbi:MAG: hypothetical protein GTN99_09015 [Candidatus Dadabacteria bacterium]|nr:hypothetical protein [Candidatus Dadabacteria bacterium]